MLRRNLILLVAITSAACRAGGGAGDGAPLLAPVAAAQEDRARPIPA
jgi:hypothetical protein